MSQLTKYPQPSVTVDIVWLSISNSQLQVAATPRDHEPFKGGLSLPGSFVRIDETLTSAVSRVLNQHSDQSDLFLEQLFTFGELDRDPRGRVISVSYFAITATPPATSTLQWFDINHLPPLAFDHANIIQLAQKRIQDKFTYSDLAKYFLPLEFTLSQLQTVYEIVLNKPQDKRNFRKKFLSTDLLSPLQKTLMASAHRPAQLFSFKHHQTTYF